jgi:hypothetical protein
MFDGTSFIDEDSARCALSVGEQMDCLLARLIDVGSSVPFCSRTCD